MGNSSSSSGRNQHDDAVDFGSLSPQWFTGPRDWNQAIVSQLICQRRLAPFYRPLEEYEDTWDDEQILAARKEPVDASGEGGQPESSTRIESSPAPASRPSHRRPSSIKEPPKPEAAIYRGAVECPICFLYYPPNINHSRCCDQAICTECFVQIKRSEPTATHLVSEPAACPYCVQDNFGIVYTPPPWRAGIGSEGSPFPWSDSPKTSPGDSKSPVLAHKRRQKSYGHDSPEVVTTDQIRPDWEAKLAAVRAAVARRANRRIIMRQVGDRLIPVGVTSGRVHAINGEDGQTEANDTGRRSRRRNQQQSGFDQLLGGMAGQDLEELMIMEAMRLSLIEHEEQQRKEAEEKKKKAAEEAAKNPTSSPAGPSNLESPPTQDQPSSLPTPTSHSQFNTQLSLPPSSSSVAPTPNNGSASSSRGDRSDADNSLIHRPNPPPFSTLNAALCATSTASAFLRASDVTPPSQETNHDDAHAATVDTPAIDTAQKSSGQQAQEDASSILEPSPSYNVLPSSPEPDSANEALLGGSISQSSLPASNTSSAPS